MADQDRIEIWPVMGRLAIALRETIVFRFWCLVLHLARQQSGRKRRINNVVISIDDLAIFSVKLIKSPRQFRRYLMKAKEINYIRSFVPLGYDTYRVYFTGQKRMAAHLEARAESAGVMNSEEWDRRKLFISPADFAQITKFSGAIFASWLAVAIDHERRVTWDYMRCMWTVTRQSIEAWIATQPDIYRIENWGVTRAPYHTGDDTESHLLHNDRTKLYHFQRGNTYGVKNASQRFAAQGQIWIINGLAGQSTLSTAEVGSDVPRFSSRHNRHSVRPVQMNPDVPMPMELRTNFKSVGALAKQRNRRPSQPMYLLNGEVLSLRRFGKARRVWVYDVPIQSVLY